MMISRTAPPGIGPFFARARRLCVGWLPILLLLACPASASDAGSYARELAERADAAALHEHPIWTRLLHLQPFAGIGPRRSLADDDGFFLSPAGKRDAQAELHATLAAFFERDARHAASQTAQCRFRARYQWLRSELGFDDARLPVQPCERYEAWRAGIAADRLTLVYAAAYINSPASMFGHTLLRIDPPQRGPGSALLAHSINYSVSTAAAEQDMLFELKGLLGFYQGEFTNAPYYLRVREYSHLEDRDLWEYELALEPDERDRLLAHTWELGFTRFDYYFFDENCSYHLLSLLDVARPSLRLSEQFVWRAIPSDTVKAVVSVPGLVRQRVYRPSASSQLAALAATLDAAALADARALAERRADPATVARQADALRAARTLDAAERHVSIRAAQGAYGNDEAQALRLSLLARRAALPELPEQAVPEAGNAPEQGHGSLRVEWHGSRGLGADTTTRLRLDLSPAYHELLDPDPGFVPASQIRLMGVGLMQHRGGGMRLHHLRAVDVLSLAPRRALRDDRAWKVGFGWRREFGRLPEDAPLVFGLHGGPGLALEPRRGTLMFALWDNQVWWNPKDAGQRLRLTSGVHAGLLLDLSERWRLLFEIRHRKGLDGAADEQAWSLRQRWQLTTAANLVLHCEGERRRDDRRSECGLGVQRYW